MSIQVDRPRLVDTGAACAQCLKVAPEELLRCAACTRIWYCSAECQRAHWKEHKAACKTLKLFNRLHEDLPQDIRPKDSKEFYVQRVNARALLMKLLGHPLAQNESRPILIEAKCSVCFKTRDQLPEGHTLQCCPTCHWGWACTPHAPGYLQGAHTATCEQYRRMHQCEIWLYNFVTTSSRMPSFCPSAVRSDYQPLPTPSPVPCQAEGATSSASSTSGEDDQDGDSVWARYFKWREVPHPFDDPGLLHATVRLSQALTTLLALQHHYSQEQLAQKTQLVIHVVGAANHEVPGDPAWEELHHLLPALRTLHVAFVGPEVEVIIEQPDDQRMIALPTCGECKGLQRTRSYSYHAGAYHEFVRRVEAADEAKEAGAGSKGQLPGSSSPEQEEQEEGPLARVRSSLLQPDLLVAFNSGIHEDEHKTWVPTLKLITDKGWPWAFTSYNKVEGAEDEAVWRRLGARVTLTHRLNPYHAIEPLPEPDTLDAFYHHSMYWMCGQGRA